MRNIIRLFRESLSGEERSYTTGSIDRAIALLSIPMVLEMVMESLFALVDAYFVAKVSADAMATVGITESILTLVYAVAIGLSTAPMAMVSRFIGEGKPDQASRAAKQAIYLAIFVSILISIPGVLFAPDILRLMGGSESLVASGQGFTRIMFGSNLVIMLLFLLNGIFRGAGEATYAMRALWIANGINIVLDPLLIFGFGPIPAMGVAGAAVATTIGRGVGVGYQLYLMLSGRSVVKLYLGGWRLDFDMLRRLWNIAFTGATQYLIASASWIFLMRIIARFGSEAVAGYTIGIRLILFTLLPVWGLSNAAATLVGQNLGAQQPERAAKSVWRAARVAVIMLAFISVIYFIGAPYFIAFFDTDPEVMAIGIATLRIFCSGYVIYGTGMILGQAFNGAGDTRTPTYINLLCFWAIEIPLGYFFAITMDWAVPGIAWAVVVSECIMTLIYLYFFRQGRWQTVQV